MRQERLTQGYKLSLQSFQKEVYQHEQEVTADNYKSAVFYRSNQKLVSLIMNRSNEISDNLEVDQDDRLEVIAQLKVEVERLTSI